MTPLAHTTTIRTWRWGRYQLSLTRSELAMSVAPAAVEAAPEPPPVVHIGWGRLIGLLVAVLLAYAAQGFFDGAPLRSLIAHLSGGQFPPGWFEPNRMRIGAALYVAALMLFGWLAPVIWTQPERARRTGRRTSLRREIVLIGAVASAAFAIGLFADRGESALVRWLWMGGIGLLLASQAPRPALSAWVSMVNRSLRTPERLVGALAIVIVLGAALWLRVNRLETIPYDFHGDMASYGIQAREFLLGQQVNIFQEGWANIPMVGYFPAIASMAIFGNDLFGLNMSAVMSGLLSLLALYLLLWRLSDSHRLALLGMALTAVSVPHIHFSRLAAYMDPWPFNLFALFLLVDGMRARRTFSLTLAGVMLGFGLQMYYSGRVIIFIVGAFLLFCLLFRRAWIRDNLGGLALAVLGILVTLGPSVVYFARNQEAFVERSRAVFLFYPAVMDHLMGKYHVTTPWQVFLEQTRLCVLMFHASMDSSTQFGYRHPMFSSLVSPLIALGFGYSLRRWRTPGAGLALIFWVLNLFLGGILTGDAPFWPRLVGMFFVGAWFAALALDRLWAALVQVRLRPGQPAAPFSRSRRAFSWGLAILIAGFIAFTGWQDWNLYYETVKTPARPQTLLGRYLDRFAPDIAVCDFETEYALRVRETAFLAWPRPLVDLPTEAPDGLIETCPGPPFIWIIYPEQLAATAPGQATRLDALRSRWPGGAFEEFRLPGGQLLFASYRVTTGAPSLGAVTPPPVPPGGGSHPAAPTAPGGYYAYNPDGSPFKPQQTFLGDTTGTVWQIDAGPVMVSGGQLLLRIGAIPGHDAVLDYVRLLSADGNLILVEAEMAAQEDALSEREGADGHWWLQAYNPFSGRRGLVAQKNEMTPVLTIRIEAPDGAYRLQIGSFKGDPNNGVFALGMTVDNGQ